VPVADAPLLTWLGAMVRKLMMPSACAGAGAARTVAKATMAARTARRRIDASLSRVAPSDPGQSSRTLNARSRAVNGHLVVGPPRSSQNAYAATSPTRYARPSAFVAPQLRKTGVDGGFQAPLTSRTVHHGSTATLAPLRRRTDLHEAA